jgi:RimJ/RimL family protein N-acetyltransferase
MPIIRRATVTDAAAVADVINAVIGEGRYTLFDRPFSVDEERQFIASLGERSALFAAEVDGAMVGVQSIDLFVGFPSMRHVGTVGTWLVPGARGRGLGRLLAERSLAFARAHDYEKIVIQVLASNEPALRFYRGLGFRDIGVARRHVRLGSQLYDEVYLELLLPDGEGSEEQGYFSGP